MKNLLIFELYIPQREDWPFLSPMRIIRSLRKGYIPLNIGKYESILLDQICINVKNLSEFQSNAKHVIIDYKSKIKFKLDKYNKNALLENNKVLLKIKEKLIKNLN